MVIDSKIRTILRLSSQAFGHYKLQIITLTILGFLSGILEGIGINAIIPLFAFVTKQQSELTDFISQFIEKTFLFFHISFNLKYLLVFVSLLFMLKAMVSIWSSYINAKITADYEEQVRNNLFSKTLSADWQYLLKQKLGYFENTIMNDISFSSNLLRQGSATIIIFTSLIIYLLVAINISVYITLITVGLGIVLFFAFKPLIHKTRIIAQETSILNKQIAHLVNESLVGVKTIKAMFMEKAIIKVAQEHFAKLKQLRISIFLLKNISNSSLQPISLIFICVVFAFAYKSSNFQFAALMAVVYLIQKIFQYLQQLQANLHSMGESVPYLRNVLNFKEDAIISNEKDTGKKVFDFNRALEFKDVSFLYEESKVILNGINFVIKKGEMVGLIGPSGAGKTTIVDLVLRLFRPSQGKILLDETDIQDIRLREWRQNIGYVPQDLFLINDTIFNNIRYYDNTISEADVIKVAKMANIYDFVQQCPKKFATVIGERGVMLSTGQRQRIVIARVLARQPKFIILDEATSALDNESERIIQKVIENLKGNVTVLVVAHRLSTIVNCDKLIVIDKGKIEEQGIPGDLLKDNKSYFYRAYNIKK